MWGVVKLHTALERIQGDCLVHGPDGHHVILVQPMMPPVSKPGTAVFCKNPLDKRRLHVPIIWQTSS